MRWLNMETYDNDFALVEFTAPNAPDEAKIVGCAVTFGGKWKEPYTGREYLDNNGNPLIPVSWVNLDDLSNFLDNNG